MRHGKKFDKVGTDTVLLNGLSFVHLHLGVGIGQLNPMANCGIEKRTHHRVREVGRRSFSRRRRNDEQQSGGSIGI